jgi:PAS domain-containing protein
LDSSWKRFQDEKGPAPPVLTLDREGTIRSLTQSACRVLEYESEEQVVDCFFSHVHRRNMRRVMRDLADMVCRGKQRARWLLRLWTGNDRWRWYRVAVRNRFREEEGRILVYLQPL